MWPYSLAKFKGAVEYFHLCEGKDVGFVSGKFNDLMTSG